MIKAVLFDLDDTLFDHRYAARCALQKLRARNPALQCVSQEELERRDFVLLQEKHQLVLAGSVTIDESRAIRIRELFEGCGQRLSDEETKALAAERAAVYRESRQAVPGALELLRVLQGRSKIGIVTNNMTEEQRGKLTACRFDGLVDLLVTSENTGYIKPAPEIFRVALDGLGVQAEDAIMVGDVWEIDIAGARNAGIRPVWFNRFGLRRPDPEEGVVEITSLERSYLQKHPSGIFDDLFDPF
jgi:putative hydrolase of the HAD superfamily